MDSYACAFRVDPGYSWPPSKVCPVACGKGAHFVRRSQDAWPLEAVSRSSADERQRQGPIEGYKPNSAEPGGSQLNLNPDEQLKAAQVRVVKLEAAIVAIGDEDPAAAGLKEALAPKHVCRLSCVQCKIGLHTPKLLGPFQEEDGGIERRSFQNPGSDGG